MRERERKNGKIRRKKEGDEEAEKVVKKKKQEEGVANQTAV